MSDNAFINQEAFNLLCRGDLLDRGMSRMVFVCRLLPDCVVKTEDTSGSFQNVLEWEAWQRVKGTEHAKWFAPCEYISPSGAVLIQKRTTPAWAHQFPDRVPVFLTDLKRSNFGMLGRQLVCHDYGVNLLMENGMSKRMKKAEWWEEAA